MQKFWDIYSNFLTKLIQIFGTDMQNRANWSGLPKSDGGGCCCPRYEFIGIPYLGWIWSDPIAADAEGVAMLAAGSRKGKLEVVDLPVVSIKVSLSRSRLIEDVTVID